MQKFFGASHLAVLTGLTTFSVGFAITPMVLAPFSEINGRYPVFAAAAIVYTTSQTACSAATSLAGMVIARFFTGVGASVFSTMVGGFIADLWEKEDRNMPMAVFSGAGIAGTGDGLLAAAAIVHFRGNEETGKAWQWVFWRMGIVTGAASIAPMMLMREIRGPVLLSRKAGALNSWYEQLEATGSYGVWVSSESPTSVQTGERQAKGCKADIASSKPAATFTTALMLLHPQAQSLKRKIIRWVVKKDEERASVRVMITISLQCAVQVETFFKNLKEQYRSLKLIPGRGMITIEAEKTPERKDTITEAEVRAQIEEWGTE
ncbi:hypothetical protein MRS44_003692 [Fusarium solani]|uniref:uncharacterized protein n=1 Tax=Fusarium solani TaxID=169388 RepID=UPI0032C43AC9|nr:hypothetical protein MRS44_003692 [Fusarium solani]